MTVQELKDRAGKALHDARALMNAADAKGEVLAGDGLAQYETLMAAFDADRDAIRSRERLESAEMSVSSHGPVAGRAATSNTIGVGSEEYRTQFWKAMRTGVPDEFRVMTVATDTAGGHTVPDEFRKVLIEKLTQEVVMRELATVISSTSGTMTIPTVTTDASAGWVAENAAYNESEAVLGSVTFSAYKQTVLTKLSEELLNDSAFDLSGFMAGQYAKALGILEETAFTVGDGSSKPTGVVNGSTLGKSATATNAITADELMDLQYALGRAYRKRASWLMHDSTVKALRKLKTGVSSDNTYLWSPGLDAAEPDRLLGNPVFVSRDMATVATGNKSVLFGDFSYYWIVDRAAVGMIRLNELYAASGNVGFRINRRVDGKLVNADAVQHLIQA
jgi:HK97 family phage major capsid protein